MARGIGVHRVLAGYMQHMMAAEGKLVLRPDGSYSETTPQVGS